MAWQRVLITGAAGFMGNAFLRHLQQADARVETLTLDLLTYAGHRENFEGLPDPGRHRFVRADVADPEAVRAAFERFEPEAVVHFAAETHVDRSNLDPQVFVRTNVLGTQVVLDAARQAAARLVHVSTDEVYGSLEAPQRATPASPLRPSNPYAASKAAADLMVQAAARTHDQDVIVTRATNNYGPRQTCEKLVPLMIRRAQAARTLPVYGDGAQVRQWLHVDDHAAGILAVLERGRAGAVYHLAGPSSRANLEVVERIVDLVGARADLVRHVADRPAHDIRYALDDAATRDELGWTPAIAFEEGLASTARWYRENEAWCEQTTGADLQTFLDGHYVDRPEL